MLEAESNNDFTIYKRPIIHQMCTFVKRTTVLIWLNINLLFWREHFFLVSLSPVLFFIWVFLRVTFGFDFLVKYLKLHYFIYVPSHPPIHLSFHLTINILLRLQWACWSVEGGCEGGNYWRRNASPCYPVVLPASSAPNYYLSSSDLAAWRFSCYCSSLLYILIINYIL